MHIFVFCDFEVENGEQCVPAVGARLLPLPQGLQLARGEQAGGHQVRPQHLHLRYHGDQVQLCDPGGRPRCADTKGFPTTGRAPSKGECSGTAGQRSE